MRAVIQRVNEARVRVDEKPVSSMGPGLLILLGIEEKDDQEDIDWLVRKIVKMRLFNDEQGVMNYSVQDVDGALLVVSQFTLHASTKKGNRPSYIRAAPPEVAVPLYEKFVAALEHAHGKPVGTGVFGASMSVQLDNDGPVTILLDTKNKE